MVWICFWPRWYVNARSTCSSSQSKCCFLWFLTHVCHVFVMCPYVPPESCFPLFPTEIHVQSATQSTASVHILHMSKLPVITSVPQDTKWGRCTLPACTGEPSGPIWAAKAVLWRCRSGNVFQKDGKNFALDILNTKLFLMDVSRSAVLPRHSWVGFWTLKMAPTLASKCGAHQLVLKLHSPSKPCGMRHGGWPCSWHAVPARNLRCIHEASPQLLTMGNGHAADGRG